MPNINIESFNVKIGMYKTCFLLEQKVDNGKRYTKVTEFKYKELDIYFKHALTHNDEILVSLPFSSLKRRLSQIKKAGFNILQTSETNDTTKEYDIVNLIVGK